VIKTTVHIFYCATVVYYEQNSISSHSLHEPNHTIHNNSEIEGELDMISCKSSFRLIQLKVKLICYIDSLHAK